MKTNQHLEDLIFHLCLNYKNLEGMKPYLHAEITPSMVPVVWEVLCDMEVTPVSTLTQLKSQFVTRISEVLYG